MKLNYRRPKPMATSRLSKNAEIKITDSLVKVAELVNSGESPNKAIAKTAASAGIPVGHIDLMVRAYNTGRSESQRHSGGDPMEKLADFEIADASSVIELMYPSSVKSAGSILKSIEVSPVYDRSPSHEVNKLKPLSKIAYDYKIQAPIKKDDSGTFKNISSTIEKMGRDLESIRADASSYKDKMIQGITKLSNYFRTYGGVPFTVAKANSARLFGKKSDHLMDIVSNSNRSLIKQAGKLKDKLAAVDISKAPYSIIKECMDYADVHINKKAAVNHVQGLINEVISKSLGEHLPVESTGSVLDNLEKSAGLFEAAQTAFPNLNSDPYESDTADYKKYKLSNRQYAQSMALKNIRSSAAISDLLANDPIISAHHPEDVTSNFNDIAGVMPDLAETPGVIRPLLRKRLEGGESAISDADVNQMLDMELTKATTKSQRQGKNTTTTAEQYLQ
jgi:hypothetical protein